MKTYLNTNEDCCSLYTSHVMYFSASLKWLLSVTNSAGQTCLAGLHSAFNEPRTNVVLQDKSVFQAVNWGNVVLYRQGNEINMLLWILETSQTVAQSQVLERTCNLIHRFYSTSCSADHDWPSNPRHVISAEISENYQETFTTLQGSERYFCKKFLLLFNKHTLSWSKEAAET